MRSENGCVWCVAEVCQCMHVGLKELKETK